MTLTRHTIDGAHYSSLSISPKVLFSARKSMMKNVLVIKDVISGSDGGRETMIINHSGDEND